eukprot:CAMPEP_0184515496 /NCGR_PEP_ID=MMETSP0198_2-20121128/4525_1 /TAXON_ID=1112570 /ORGANISM="Thraustochytrium sp., Strain LLF1b" /LENGTH=756 /DNA_ID=CAMNT_0026905751 /DNA_START=431 /DNA_END=2701 /DNA_ORIENTATION=+
MGCSSSKKAREMIQSDTAEDYKGQGRQVYSKASQVAVESEPSEQGGSATPGPGQYIAPGSFEAALEAGGVVVNQYELTTILGEGSQAQVRLAIDDQGKQWAVKIVRKRLTLRRARAKSSGQLLNLAAPIAREIAIMKKLKHPNIVQLHEVLDLPHHNRLFLVMQYVNGGPVMDERLVGNTPLEENKARDLFGQLIKGLEYLHFHGIVHRDIKPSNLLVTRTGLLKINDFGVSAICEPVDLEDEMSDDEEDKNELVDQGSATSDTNTQRITFNTNHIQGIEATVSARNHGSTEKQGFQTTKEAGTGDLASSLLGGGDEDEEEEEEEEDEDADDSEDSEDSDDSDYVDVVYNPEDLKLDAPILSREKRASTPPEDPASGVSEAGVPLPPLPNLTLETENLTSPPGPFADAPMSAEGQYTADSTPGQPSGGFLAKLAQTPRSGFLPFVTPRAAAAASQLDPHSEEYRRLKGVLYPPTPHNADSVTHDDIMNSPPIGTYAFFPPEACSFDTFNSVQYKGKVADLWAAGVTLYMMLFGEVPFMADTRDEIFYLIRTQPLHFPEGHRVSQDAIDLVEELLQRKAFQRPDIPSIKASKWLQKGRKLTRLPHAYRTFIAPTQDEVNAAVTDVDLSVGITPLQRSHSWTSPYKSDRKPLRHASSSNSSGTKDESGDQPGPLVAIPPIPHAISSQSDGAAMPVLSLDTTSASTSIMNEKPHTRPVSLPTRQLRPQKLQHMMDRRLNETYEEIENPPLQKAETEPGQ